jgi:hypothetical protein
MGIPRKQKPSPAEGEFLFQLDPEPLEECVTAYGGIPLFLQAARSLDVPGRVNQHLQLKQRQRGLDEAGYVESFLVLNALGGDCLDDFDRLREDEGLAEMLGHEVPSPEAARKFLYQFHDAAKLEDAQKELPVGQVSYIAEESAPLRALAQVNQGMVQEVGSRCPDQGIATIDLDATIIESYKREAQATYEGGSGYQPMLALWAEMNLVLADEFRDGNVPAQKEPLRVARRAFQALPPTVREYYFRGDSACWEKELLKWLRDDQRAGGPRGPITFGISVRMTANLKKHIARLPGSMWKPYREDSEAVRECADVLNYWPEEGDRPEDAGPLRYIAIRVRKRQGRLFADGSEVKYFAVASNRWDWEAVRLLDWQREKAGTIEALHDVLKNELAAGVMPCGRLGANAAWLRLAVMTHNVLSALKRLALPAKWLTARPKRLRFQIFCSPGKLVSHARQTWLRVRRLRDQLAEWIETLRLLPIPLRA